MRGLYAIIDVEALSRRGIDPVAFAERLLDARPALIQVRDKQGGARRTLELLRAIVPLAARAGVPVFANDRPDLAMLAGCDGVHVGQDDVPVAMIRAIAPRLRVGLSTHDAAQVEQAIAEAPDYIAIGPIFPTVSKDNPSPVVGLAALGELAARVRRARPGTPIVAIGGISLETAPAVGAIADAAAIIGALVPAGDPPRLDEIGARARALHEAIVGEGS